MRLDVIVVYGPSLPSDIERLQSLRAVLASAANEGLQICIASLDDEIGPGACEDIASMLAVELQEAGFEPMIAQIMVEGESGHEWVVVLTSEGLVSVDVPVGVYEEWDQRGWLVYRDVAIGPSDIIILPFDPEDFGEFTPYVYPFRRH